MGNVVMLVSEMETFVKGIICGGRLGLATSQSQASRAPLS